MSDDIEDIAERFKKVAGRVGPKTIVPASVTAINNDDTIAIVFSDGSMVDDCRLKAMVKDGNKLVLVPAVDSMVMVARIENSDEFIVISVDEVSRIDMIIGTVRQKVDEDGFVFQRGTDTMWEAMKLLIESLEPAVILQGKNIDRVKLLQAKTKFKNILNGA